MESVPPINRILKWPVIWVYSIINIHWRQVVFFLGFATSKTGKKGYLVGGLEHDFYEFPYIVNNNPN